MQRYAIGSTSWFAKILLTFAAYAWACTALGAGEQSGVRVSGTADYLYQPCVSFACEPATGNWHASQDGAAGDSSAAVAWPGGINSELGYSALAQLNCPLALPSLGAYGAAVTQFGTHPGYSSDCCYLNSVHASGQATSSCVIRGRCPANGPGSGAATSRAADPGVSSIWRLRERTERWAKEGAPGGAPNRAPWSA